MALPLSAIRSALGAIGDWDADASPSPIVLPGTSTVPDKAVLISCSAVADPAGAGGTCTINTQKSGPKVFQIPAGTTWTGVPQGAIVGVATLVWAGDLLAYDAHWMTEK